MFVDLLYCVGETLQHVDWNTAPLPGHLAAGAMMQEFKRVLHEDRNLKQSLVLMLNFFSDGTLVDKL